MSTPTPRTIKTWSALFVGENDALISKAGHDWRSHPDHYERTSLVKEEDYRTLETELTAALARIAELELEARRRRDVFAERESQIESLTRQLAEKDSRIAELEKDNDDKEAAYQNVSGHVQRLQDERNELRIRDDQWKTKFEQTHLTWAADGVRRDELEAELRRQLSESQAQLEQARSYHSGYCNEAQGKGRCNCWVVSVGEKDAGKYDTRVKDLEAQLASVREDSATMDFLGNPKEVYWIEVRTQPHGTPIFMGHKVEEFRAKIAAARGVTSPPAVAETGEKDALANSQETEGLEPFTPINPPRFGTLTTSWGEECTVKVYGSLDDGKVALFNYTTEGRLVTGALAQMDSIEFDSPMTPPPQGKEQE